MHPLPISEWVGARGHLSNGRCSFSISDEAHANINPGVTLPIGDGGQCLEVGPAARRGSCSKSGRLRGYPRLLRWKTAALFGGLTRISTLNKKKRNAIYNLGKDICRHRAGQQGRASALSAGDRAPGWLAIGPDVRADRSRHPRNRQGRAGDNAQRPFEGVPVGQTSTDLDQVEHWFPKKCSPGRYHSPRAVGFHPHLPTTPKNSPRRHVNVEGDRHPGWSVISTEAQPTAHRRWVQVVEAMLCFGFPAKPGTRSSGGRFARNIADAGVGTCTGGANKIEAEKKKRRGGGKIVRASSLERGGGLSARRFAVFRPSTRRPI